MGGAHLKVSAIEWAASKGVLEFTPDSRNEHKALRDCIMGEGQGMSDGDESKINDPLLEVYEAHVQDAATIAYNPLLEKQQHLSSSPIVRWDRFLPLRSLKVLLVENDDSTRQVVSALLRNCCYEVTAAENGLEAWRVLEDGMNHIDLVLTEVVMPCLSGIGLLCKIMSHKACRTIPVIMMSSNDSMGIVFKCLSKGAVDFLVKPIRKNELKNLWQHVWRRCHSSCGSGSESVVQGQKFAKSKSEDESNNNTGSNDEDNGSVGLNSQDGSDNGSGTQSSWIKCAVEVDSPQPMSPCEQLAILHDSTCAQVTHTLAETFCSKNVQRVTAGANRKKQKKFSDDFMGKDLEAGRALRNTDVTNDLHQSDKVLVTQTNTSREKLPENQPNNIDPVHYANRSVLPEQISQAFSDHHGGNSINPYQLSVSTLPNAPNSTKISENKDNGYVESPSSLELSLKRLRSARERDERNVLKRSNMSAFSRYPVSGASVPTSNGIAGNSVLENSSSEAAPLNQGSNGGSSNNDKGSTNINVVTKPGICSHPASAFHPVHSQNSIIQPAIREKIDEAAATPAMEHSMGFEKQVQVQHHHHHFYHHHHHHVHALPPQPDLDESSLENKKATVAYCSSSNVFTRPVEANAINYSINGSNSGSNHGSDGQNGGSTGIINTGGTNVEGSPIGLTEKSGVGSGNDGGNGTDQTRFSQREAALNKFRQKRKERNFGKKVRYQSRKRLAEQRPRVRGQFVRRIVYNENQESYS